MKKTAILLLALVFGAAVFSLSGVIGSWADRIFFRPQVRLSEVFRSLEEGGPDAHQKALRDWVLSEEGTKKLRAIALYDLGNYSLATAVSGDAAAVKDAFFYFKEALRNDPSLFPAKHNLEILLKNEQQEKKEQEKDSTSGQTGSQEMDDEKRPQKGLIVPKPLLGGSP